MGSSEAQGFSRSMIEFIHGVFDLSVGDGIQGLLLREVLTNEPIGILVQTTLPRGIRMRKVDPSLKVIGHALMVSKFATIVIGDRTNPLLIGHERFSDGLADRIGLFVLEGTDDGVRRFTLDQRYQGTTMAFAAHRVAFPVTKTAFSVNDSRALIHRHPLWNNAPPVVAPITLTSPLPAAQRAARVATRVFIRVDRLVNPLMADAHTLVPS